VGLRVIVASRRSPPSLVITRHHLLLSRP